MEQFVLVPASVYNKNVTTQPVTKQELPKYKTEQPPTCQIDFLMRDINKRLFDKTDTLIDKISSCSRIKHSNSQTNILMVLILECCSQTLLCICVGKTWTFGTFTLLDAAGLSPSLVVNHNAKAKDRESWVSFKM